MILGRPRSLAFQHRDLLSEGEDFEGRIGSAADENADHGEDGEDELRHELTLLTWRNVARTGNLLPPQTTHSRTSRSFGYTQAR